MTELISITPRLLRKQMKEVKEGLLYDEDFLHEFVSAYPNGTPTNYDEFIASLDSRPVSYMQVGPLFLTGKRYTSFMTSMEALIDKLNSSRGAVGGLLSSGIGMYTKQA